MKRKARVVVEMTIDGVEWRGKNIKPSELITMGAVLQEAGLKMIGECEIDKR